MLKRDIPMFGNIDLKKKFSAIGSAIYKFINLQNKSRIFFSVRASKKETIRNQQLEEHLHPDITSWEIVRIARHRKRPVLQDYISLSFSEFVEFRGDRCYSDDRSLIGGFARLDEQRVMLLGHNKGKNIQENIERNFGMAKPDGYRKALRLMKLAEKYNLPVVTLIDTSGAFPGIDAEERGQAEAIARNLLEMSRLEVPIISVITGEGGSGGALGIGVSDVLLMLSYSIYSVISPEGCAAILWRDAGYAPQAAEALKLTAQPLYELGVIDEIIQEPPGGAHNNYEQTASDIKKAILRHLSKMAKYSTPELIDRRFDKLSKIGKFNTDKIET
jgi:acetyl-CoA carboxylase carboxyl transferase subunit alpha